MSIHIITATEASRSFSNILNKVHYQGESYEIKRGKEVIARIVPAAPKKTELKVSELNTIYNRLPPLDEKDEAAFIKDIEQIRAQMKIDDEGKSWD